MKIRKLHIQNFRSLENVRLQVGDLMALVGRNNTGKSNLLKALNLFFNPSVRYVDDTAFYSQESSRSIRIVATFEDLSDLEQEKFSPWLDQDSLTVGYEVTCTGDESYNIDIVAIVTVPEPDWLQESEISGARINEWWPEQDQLVVNGQDFGRRLGTSKPQVGEWKEHAREFVEDHKEDIPWRERELKNPKGAKNVLKGSLPEFIYVPAVRDVTEETKVTQSSPFGQLIHSVLNKISADRKEEIAEELQRVSERLNRGGDAERIAEIGRVETRLNELMNELMDCDVEIEMAMPELQEVFGEAKVFANDGVRTPIEFKGHGMQRSMILTILRHYAEIANERKAGDRAAERSAIIAVEEPELYLHPQSQRTLRSVFRDIARGRDQVFLSTHSSLFVDIDYFDEVCRMRRTNGDSGLCTRGTQLTMSMMLQDLRRRKGVEGTEEGIRNQYSNAFDSVVNEGFFADKVLIVEGPSEYNIIRPIAAALSYDFDRANVATVYSNGKGQIDRLLRIFSGFRIPTFVWFDGDKENDDAEVRRKSLELLGLLGGAIDDLEDLDTRVKAHYAVLETTLEYMLRAELSDYDQLIDAARDAYGPCGKPLEAKYIGQIIAQRIEGEDGEEACPAPLVQIVENMRNLTHVSEVLHPDAEEMRIE